MGWLTAHTAARVCASQPLARLSPNTARERLCVKQTFGGRETILRLKSPCQHLSHSNPTDKATFSYAAARTWSEASGCAGSQQAPLSMLPLYAFAIHKSPPSWNHTPRQAGGPSLIPPCKTFQVLNRNEITFTPASISLRTQQWNRVSFAEPIGKTHSKSYLATGNQLIWSHANRI